MVQVSGHGGSDPGGGQNYPGQSNGSGTHRTDKCAARTRAFGLKQAEKQWDNGHSRKVRSATTASGHFEFEMPASFRVSFEDTRAAHGGLRCLPAVPGFSTWPQSVARSGSPSTLLNTFEHFCTTTSAASPRSPRRRPCPSLPAAAAVALRSRFCSFRRPLRPPEP